MENDAAHNRESIQRFEGQIAETSRSGEDTDREIQEKQEEMAQKERQIADSRDRLLQFTQRLEELRRGADEATQKMEQAALQLAQYNASLAEQRIQLSSTQSSMAEIRLRAGAGGRQCQTGPGAPGCRPGRGCPVEGNAGRGRAGGFRPGERSAGATRCVWKAAQAGQRRREAWNQLTLDVGEQQRRAKLLEDLERNLEGFAQSVKQVMKEAGRGMLAGICGPVTQLLKTPREYAVALETALGAAMQNVVVETEQDAKNAIRVLKQRDWAGPRSFP